MSPARERKGVHQSPYGRGGAGRRQADVTACKGPGGESGIVALSMRAVIIIIGLYVVAGCMMPGKATANQPPPLVETVGGQIIVKVSDISLSKFLEHVSLCTSTPIRVVDGGDFPVTIDGRFSSLEQLLEQVCEGLAVVYERREDGGFRIVKAEAYSRAPDTASEPRSFYRPDQLLVQFKPDVDAAEIEALHAATGSRVLRVIHDSRIHQVALLEDGNLSAAIKAYQASPIVKKVGRNSLRYPLGIVPNDPKFSEQWALGAVRAPNAWSITTGAPDVVVAVVGTGVDYHHPDLSSNIWINTEELHGEPGVDDDGNGFVDDVHGWDFAGERVSVYDDGTPDPMDRYGHGTQVAGIIAAVGDNGIGVAGVSWQTKILPLKVLADDTDSMEMVDIIAAIDYAIAAGARVVNCSFGGPDSNVNPDGTMLDGTDNLEWEAFTRLGEAGILAVCAAGNSGNDNDQTPLYPASYRLDNILSVGWQIQAGRLSINSNFGKNSVHLAAPGENVLSTALNAGLTDVSNLPLDDDGLYTSMSGSSSATPHVSGTAALIYSVRPSMNFLQTREAILGSVRPFSFQTDQDKIYSGGTLDTFGALRFLGFLKGDVNLDGRVDSFDAVLLLRHAAGLIELTDVQKENGNITGHEDNDRVGIPDVAAILRVVGGGQLIQDR
ncbi:MAG: S8 family serine peptidase [Desulfatiglandaceae bacterium]